MAKRNRTKTVYINSIITLISQIMQVLLGFVIRKFFITYLGITYLGYNSVFTNILQMLNLADMGIGVAITSFLYKPLAEEEYDRVKALMYLYKRIYGIIGLVVLLIGIVVSFFLPVLIPDAMCSKDYLMLLFYINLTATVSTYYLSYKRTLLIADQKSYIISIIDTAGYFIMSLVQLAILLFYPDYVLYLIATVMKNIVSNIIISFKSDQIYGKISGHEKNTYYKEYRPQVLMYVKDVIVSRIGAFVYYSTDNIIISFFKGSLLTGYLSNYTLVITQVTNIVNQILAAIQATFGNYINLNENPIKQKKMIDNYQMVNYCIANFCCICLMFLIQPFIQIIFGKEYVLDFSIVILLSVNLMLTIMLQLPSQLFMIFKLYKYDRPIIVVSASLNIIVSCILVQSFGIAGVLVGTFITSLFYVFSRYYIVSKKVYKESFVHSLKQFERYFIVSVINVMVVFFAVRNIAGTSLKSFIVRIVVVFFLAILVPLLCLSFTDEFKFLINKFIPNTIRRFYSNWGICFITLLVIGWGSWMGSIFADTSYVADMSNKSLPRHEIYILEESIGKKIYHFSLDDFIMSFKDITENENKYESIFDNRTFAWLKELHDKYGVVMSCYVYYEEGDFNLDKCTHRFKSEFERNAAWLRFGFHTLNGNTIYGNGGQQIAEDYQKTVVALTEIVSDKAIDNVIRLQSFQGNEIEIKALKNIAIEPVVGLFTADDNRQSYYLDAKQNAYIFCHDYLVDDTIFFISTDLRAEFIESVSDKIDEFKSEAWNNQKEYLELFSHEWILDNKVKLIIEDLCSYARNQGYDMKFYEDVLVTDTILQK